jgi:rpsU-divergently transcribed protein
MALLGCSRRVLALYAHYDQLRCPLVLKNYGVPWRSGKANFTFEAPKAPQSDVRITKEAFLEHCLFHDVPTRGFRIEAMQAAAVRLGLSPAWIARIDRGPVELVEWWREHELRTTRKRLGEKGDWRLVDADLQVTAQQSSGQLDLVVWTRARLLSFLQTAFRLREPYRRHWAQALALQLQPNHTAQGLKLLAQTCDEMAWFAGDRSTDVQWYRRRAAIAPLFQLTELYWIATLRDAPTRTNDEQDISPNSFNDAETWHFAERLLDDTSVLMRLWWPALRRFRHESSEWLAMAQILGQGVNAWARAWTRGFL